MTIANLQKQQNNSLQKIFQLLVNKPMMVILGFGFASGLPLGLTGATLQAWYAIEAVPIATIGLLALIGQPYVYKFLWAPFMDAVVLPFGGRRRGWLFATQIGIAAALVGMAFLTPSHTPMGLACAALVLASLSASQDIVVDAYRTELLEVAERGTGAAMYVTGYRIALLISSGLSLVIASYFGFKIMYLIMAAIMGVALIVTAWADEPTAYSGQAPRFKEAVIAPFKAFMKKDCAVGLLFLVVYYKLGDAFAGALTNPFLVDLGFTLQQIGWVYKTVGMAATLLGAFIGGVLLSRLTLFSALFWFGLLQAFSNLAYMVLADAGAAYGLMVAVVAIENLCGGMGTAAFLTLLMSLCDLRYTATQFALLSALSAVGRVYITPVAGFMVAQIGWSQFYFWTCIIALPSLLLLWLLARPINQAAIDHKPATKALD